MHGWRKSLADFELLMPVVLLGLVLVYVSQLVALPPVTRRMPLLGAALTGVLLLVELARVIAGRAGPGQPRPASANRTPRNLPLFLLLLGCFALAIWLVGYYLAAAAMVPALMWLLGERRPVPLILTTGVYLVAVYLVFDLVFRLRFPQGLLF